MNSFLFPVFSLESLIDISFWPDARFTPFPASSETFLPVQLQFLSFGTKKAHGMPNPMCLIKTLF